MYNHEPENYHCPFCDYIVTPNMPYEVYRDDDIYAFISSAMWPHNPGIVIIIPIQHIENIYDMTDELMAKVHVFAKKAAIAMKRSYYCDAISTRQHNEPDGNQTVMHYHFQVIPRYHDDNLYINHKEKSDIAPEERLKYAKIIKAALEK